MFFPESKGRELEDFDRLFAGEEDAAFIGSMSGDRDLDGLARNNSVAVKGGVIHEEKGLGGSV